MTIERVITNVMNKAAAPIVEAIAKDAVNPAPPAGGVTLGGVAPSRPPGLVIPEGRKQDDKQDDKQAAPVVQRSTPGQRARGLLSSMWQAEETWWVVGGLVVLVGANRWWSSVTDPATMRQRQQLRHDRKMARVTTSPLPSSKRRSAGSQALGRSADCRLDCHDQGLTGQDLKTCMRTCRPKRRKSNGPKKTT